MNKKQEEAAAWYYVEDRISKGPFTQTQMKEFIDQSLIGSTTCVWNAGAKDWILLKDSELKKYHQRKISQSMSQRHGSKDLDYADFHAILSLEEKDIVFSVVFSVITCGIYKLIWLYSLAKQINDLMAVRVKAKMIDPLLVVIFSVATFGLYTTYFFYKSGKAMYMLGLERDASDNSALFAVTSFFSKIVSMAIVQNEINARVRYAKQRFEV